jgi:hypothetical protein
MKSKRNLRQLCLLCATMLPAVAQAQFTFTTNNGAITITAYTGSGGAVVIPSATNGYPVVCIGTNAFAGSSLTSVKIPGSVTNIGNYAFEFCAHLAGLTISNGVAGIGQSVFLGCAKLMRVVIPGSVTSLGKEAFYGCSHLTNAIIGGVGNSIGEDAFEGCSSLTNILIGGSVTSIKGYAFYACDRLASIYFLGNAPSAGTGAFSGGTLYYLPGMSGWTAIFSGHPTALWNPQFEVGDASFGVRTNRFDFKIIGTTNIPIVLEACTNPASANWTPLQSCCATNGSINFSDSQWTNYPARFYRVRSP